MSDLAKYEDKKKSNMSWRSMAIHLKQNPFCAVKTNAYHWSMK